MASLFKEDPWVLKIKELLQPLDYVIVKTEQMQGLLLTVFTKRKHLLHLREIETDYTRTGFGGMWVSSDLLILLIRKSLLHCQCLCRATKEPSVLD